MWHTAKYGDPYSECVLCIYHPKCTHTQQWTHIREHTPRAVGSHLCCSGRWSVGSSVPCSRATQSWYWRWRECCTFTPPLTIPAVPRLELATFRLWVRLSTIRPWLPPKVSCCTHTAGFYDIGTRIDEVTTNTGIKNVQLPLQEGFEKMYIYLK